MRAIVLLNKRGLTLVEVMIALVVLLLVSLALMQTALLSIDSNMKNALRDEAVRIAAMRMEEARTLEFTQTADRLVDDTGSLAGADCPPDFPATGVLVARDVRSVSGFDFCTNMDVWGIDADTRRVIITVGWKWKDEPYTHAISTVMRKTT